MSAPTPEAAAPTPVTDVQPKPAPPATPAAEEFKYPADTPLSGMDAAQQAEYWREKAQHHEKAWRGKAGDVTPEQVREFRDKAKRFDEFEESQKSEQQKLTDRATKAEAKVTEIEARALRAEVAAAKGIPAALLSGSTQEELEASADALLAFRGEKPRPDFGGGNRGGDVAPVAQLTQADVTRLYKEKRYDEIEAARTGGRIASLLGPPH